MKLFYKVLNEGKLLGKHQGFMTVIFTKMSKWITLITCIVIHDSYFYTIVLHSHFEIETLITEVKTKC